MQQQAGAKLVVVGNSSANEHPEAGAERALNARQYLVTRKGIDDSRIEAVRHSPPRRVRSAADGSSAIRCTAWSALRWFQLTNLDRELDCAPRGRLYGVFQRHGAFGLTYQPHRNKSSRSRGSAPAKAAPTASSSTPEARPPGSVPSTTTKPNRHAKPSPATPMPVQPTQGKRVIRKPSPATPIQAAGGKPSPATPMPQPGKERVSERLRTTHRPP